MAIDWIKFPRSHRISEPGLSIIQVFQDCENQIDSSEHQHNSDRVLLELTPGLSSLGYEVETGKSQVDKVSIPVLYGKNGKPTKSYDVDAYNREMRYIVEVEAGAGVANNRFLVDLVKACTMSEVDRVCIAVRNQYGKAKDFNTVTNYLESIYVSGRLVLPLDEVLIVGY